jgi:beta-galactosidase
MINPKLPKVWYGGDYNPDQWPREVWEEDMRLFKLAHIDVATLPVFSWAKLQPEEDRYDFGWLDEVLDLMGRNSIYACLATSTAAHPAWMARKYPDVLRVDFEGRKRRFGRRHNSCPNSPTFRHYSVRLAEKLAERYKDHPTLVAWHVSNEYGGYCYCDNCAAAFRVWLKERYGTLEELNRRWNSAFWNHTFFDWEEIVPPNALSEHYSPDSTAFQAISLDYCRFQSDSLLECYRLEYEAIKRHSPDVLVTTNLMHRFKQLDYFKWAKYLDIVSWDSYPQNDQNLADYAMWHDLMRGLKRGQPFMLMEQTPSQVNWAAYCGLKRPGVLRLWSYQAVAHGADTVMYFQLRQSLGSLEKFHGAVIAHAGHEHTRVFREVSELGRELAALNDAVIDGRTEARVAILFDWENWWALEYSAGPSKDLKYLPQVEKYYRALWQQNIPVDFVSPEMELDKYAVLVAPVAYLLQPGYAAKVEAFVARGGTFLTTFMSGLVDENDRVVPGGYPGELRKVTGVWVEEFDPLFPGMQNEIRVEGTVPELAGTHRAELLCSIMHAETAEVVGVYGQDFYAGTPALTRNRFGEGWAWYVGADPEAPFVARLLAHICAEQGIRPLMWVPAGVEVTRRSKDGRALTFILNHNSDPVTVDLGARSRTDLLRGEPITGKIGLSGRDVLILVEEG